VCDCFVVCATFPRKTPHVICKLGVGASNEGMTRCGPGPALGMPLRMPPLWDAGNSMSASPGPWWLRDSGALAHELHRCRHVCQRRLSRPASRPAAQEAGERVYVEFGAGKGFLGLALAEAAPGAALVLVDRGAFRLGADRCAGLQSLLDPLQACTFKICQKLLRLFRNFCAPGRAIHPTLLPRRALSE